MEFGVYIDGFDVTFDEEKLPDSDDEETQQEAASNTTKNDSVDTDSYRYGTYV